MATENDYLDKQICKNDSNSDIIQVVEIGMWKTGTNAQGKLICPAPIFWYEAGVDFPFTEFDTDGIAFDKEDVEDTSTILKQSTLTQYEIVRSMTIKPSLGSRFYQAFVNLQHRDSIGGYNGALLRHYAQAGFHIRVTLTNKQKTFSWTEVYLNVMTEKLLDTYFKNITNNEAEAELTFSMQTQPIYELTGSLETCGFSIPEGITEPIITAVIVDTVGGEISLTGSITDPDSVSNGKVSYTVISDVDGATIVSGSDCTTLTVIDGLAAGDYTINLGWTVQDSNIDYKCFSRVATVIPAP